MAGIIIGGDAASKGNVEWVVKLQEPASKKTYAKIMLLGDFPRADDIAEGKPFAGRLGEFLDGLLNEAGVPRSLCVVTHVFHCRAPGADVMGFFTGEELKAERAMKPYRFRNAMLRTEYGPEMGRLRLELREWKPKVIIAFGACAFWALAGREDVAANIGRPVPVQTNIVIPVYHPEYLMHSESHGARAEAVAAIHSALDFAVVPDTQRPEEV